MGVHMTKRSEAVKDVYEAIFRLLDIYKDEIDATTAIGMLELIKHEISINQSFPALKELILGTRETND
jgi:hypothetical protein